VGFVFTKRKCNIFNCALFLNLGWRRFSLARHIALAPSC
jgi:hypothetical protein